MPDNLFSGWVARGYDAASADMYAPEVLGPTVDFLAELAGDGRALELAIGTGRVGLALTARGVDVHGIELSPDMVEQLRAKPGGDAVPVTIGDMAATRLDRTFPLVYLVYNTISNLLTQEEQVACFENAAAHLEPGGCFVIECGVPSLQRLQPGERYLAFDVSPAHLGFDTIDVVTQRQTSHHYYVHDDRVALFESQHRYAWPAELDLMARFAGLSLRERYAGFDRSPFTATSYQHVSVWQKAAL
jgi:SAM-dependent methyltransferase